MKVQIVHFWIVHDMLHQNWKDMNAVTKNECTRPLTDLIESAKKMMKGKPKKNLGCFPFRTGKSDELRVFGCIWSVWRQL